MTNGNGDHTGLDYVHPTAVTAWQLIGTVLGVFAVIVFAAWTIITNEAQNNRQITDEFKNYVTTANHNDLVNRYTDFRNDTKSDIARMLTRQAFEDFLKERNKLINRMQDDIKGAVTKVEQGLRETASKDTMTGMQGQIDELRKQLQQRYVTKDETAGHVSSDIERLQSVRREVDALRSEFKSHLDVKGR